jgi:hypothetical protein
LIDFCTLALNTTETTALRDVAGYASCHTIYLIYFRICDGCLAAILIIPSFWVVRLFHYQFL